MAAHESRRAAGPHDASPNPRRHALEVISQALSPSGRGFARDLLDDRFTRVRLKPEDARLAAELTLGVIRRLGTLDAVLSAYSQQPLRDLEPAVHQILRLGLYQILFLDRVPAHAAVDESVRLARATGKKRATGYVNGVLRAIAREVAFPREPDPARPRESFELKPGRACAFPRPVLPLPTRYAAWLAASCSVPEWLAARWLARHGTTRARELCRIANETPPLFVRPNARKVSIEQLIDRLAEEGVTAVPSRSGRTLRLPLHTVVRRLQCLREGLFQVQDESSAAVAPFLGPQPGESILDLCAAPGGKSCHMAELMECRGQIVAVDSSARRLQRVVENMRRLDLPVIATVESDGANFAVQHRGEFDRVLLDAPCSNAGVLRRRPEARWRLSDRALGELVHRQRELLSAALRCLKPGGTLVYSTCSLEPEENGELVEAVLRGAVAFRLDEQCEILPASGGGDGAFMARIVRADLPAGGVA